MRVIAIVNQKGGCGKTTTAINTASIYARRGLRTLLVDMDPQGHCAAGLGVPEARIDMSIADALVADLDHVREFPNLLWETSRNLHLAPSTVRLAGLESAGGGLHELPDKDRRLEKVLAKLAGKFDRCLIDCPPTIGLLTFNALRACHEALIPVETGFFSLRGAEKQWKTIQKTIRHIGRPIACHLFATLHREGAAVAESILNALRTQFGPMLSPAVIREHEVLREAVSFGQPVIEYAPDSAARHDFEALVDWLESTNPQQHVAESAAPHQHSVGSMLDGQPSGALPSIAAEIRGPNTRAAELVRRVHDLAARTAERGRELELRMHAATSELDSAQAAVESTRSVPMPLPVCAPPAPQPGAPFEIELEQVSHASPLVVETTPIVRRVHSDVYGARETTRGVLFVQPGALGRRICVAGDFNGWSPTATPLRFSEESGVHEAVVPLPLGEYRYRLVIDGRWEADAHNPAREENEYGETHSLLAVVRGTIAERPHSVGMNLQPILNAEEAHEAARG